MERKSAFTAEQDPTTIYQEARVPENKNKISIVSDQYNGEGEKTEKV